MMIRREAQQNTAENFTAVYYNIKLEANTSKERKREANILMETVVCVMFVASINI